MAVARSTTQVGNQFWHRFPRACDYEEVDSEGGSGADMGWFLTKEKDKMQESLHQMGLHAALPSELALEDLLQDLNTWFCVLKPTTTVSFAIPSFRRCKQGWVVKMSELSVHLTAATMKIPRESICLSWALRCRGVGLGQRHGPARQEIAATAAIVKYNAGRWFRSWHHQPAHDYEEVGA
ncbi:hypothetical protein BU16DRAFT_540167 [Lophium mytilinum]|uniref:Uncharacterized protein n=1 Tax=Lophium mytilinum TaxID=390894 RepID=A0A6A6QRY5_9PEZI|nr:hypothetical protein BU16DRAFT_540167 [Lophium mytilinum]